jgi:hypothetical protein
MKRERSGMTAIFFILIYVEAVTRTRAKVWLGWYPPYPYFVNAFIRIIISRSTLDVTFDMSPPTLSKILLLSRKSTKIGKKLTKMGKIA